MQRILGAVRLSNLTDETTSPERQRADILADPLTKAGELVAWAEDLDISADKFSPFQRPELGPWLREFVNNYDVLIFAKADRAIRSMMDMYELSKWAQEHRKVIVFVKGPGGGPRMEMDFRRGPLDTMTQFMVMVFAFAGQIELDLIKDRTRDSQKLAREQGRWHGGLPPYGYRPVKQAPGLGWRLEPDPEAKPVIDQIVNRVLDGESINSICRDFNGQGILSPRDHFRKQVGKQIRDNKWTSVVVSGILRNKALLGYAMHQDKVVRGADGLPVMQSSPILSRPTWDTLQRQLDQNSVKKPRSRTVSPLLGIAFCLNCGNARYRFGAKRDGKYDYYRCRGKIWQKTCDSASVRCDCLSQIIESQLLSHIGDLEVQEEVFIPGESHKEELQDATEALTDLLERSAGKPAAVKAIYDRQIASLEALIERLSALPEVPSGTEYRGTGKTYRELWEAADTKGRRRLLIEAGVRVEAAPADGDWVSVGRFERPERYDEAVSLGVLGKVQYAFFLPKDLVARTTGRSSNS